MARRLDLQQGRLLRECPPVEHLQAFGGGLSIEQFRQDFLMMSKIPQFQFRYLTIQAAQPIRKMKTYTPPTPAIPLRPPRLTTTRPTTRTRSILSYGVNPTA